MSTSIVVTVEETGAEVAADTLWSLGVVAVEERTAGGGRVELWTSVGEERGDIERALARIGQRWECRVEVVDDEVAQSWRVFAAPTEIDPDLVIAPSWCVPSEVPAGTTVVAIDPGSAFGLGDHPTTVLTLRSMRAVLRPGARVLDVGCGSGVLGIVACLEGAASCVGIDIAEAAVSATLANAARNGVASRCTASVTPLAEVRGEFDVVLANVLAPVLVDLAAELRRVTAGSGTLIVSGVLAGRHDHVVEALSPMTVVDRRVSGGWAAVTLAHRACGSSGAA